MTTVDETMLPATDLAVEVRMLGALQVHRPNGTVVEPGEWRTGKTADLVRLLALHGGAPVPATVLIAALWPNSDQVRAQASLRTATCRIRNVLGRDRLGRDLSGLRLRGARVDVVTFRELAAEVRRLVGADGASRAAVLAQEADALYRGDLRAHDDAADWVVAERRALDQAYQGLLCDAAEAVSSLGLPRLAVDYARRALLRDPFSERASRLVMCGHAELGETSSALREYERCRLLLADELGVDPSPQTRAVYLDILRS